MRSWESSAFSASYYGETTFLTRVRFPPHLCTSVSPRKSPLPRESSSPSQQFCWMRKTSCEKGRKSWWDESGMLEWRYVELSCVIPTSRGILFQGERVSATTVRYYSRCGSLICHWTFWRDLPVWLVIIRYYSRHDDLCVWPVGILYYFCRGGLSVWLWTFVTTSRAAVFLSDYRRPPLLLARRSFRLAT